jgi:site-specific DNA recombinase
LAVIRLTYGWNRTRAPIHLRQLARLSGLSPRHTNRPAYQRMVQDIVQGRINTVLCTALSRISRSTRDLLDMIEFFKQHELDFICLKEDFDTTTAQGRCFVTIMGALNQFEREQVGERTRMGILAGAERGLWNGGQVLGYDPDPQRKGYLIPNAEEARVVNVLFDTYLECGSVYETAARANQLGYRTKTYTSRRGKTYAPKPLSYTSVLWILTSRTYLAQKEINKCRKREDPASLPEELRYRLVDAVWPAIIAPSRMAPKT